MQGWYLAEQSHQCLWRMDLGTRFRVGGTLEVCLLSQLHWFLCSPNPVGLSNLAWSWRGAFGGVEQDPRGLTPTTVIASSIPSQLLPMKTLSSLWNRKKRMKSRTVWPTHWLREALEAAQGLLPIQQGPCFQTQILTLAIWLSPAPQLRWCFWGPKLGKREMKKKDVKSPGTKWAFEFWTVFNLN